MRFSKCVVILSLVFCLGTASSQLFRRQTPPRYAVDPSWPQVLPNNWMMGPIGHLFVDQEDHIWVFHQPGLLQKDEAALAQTPPTAECCIPAPPLLEFDAAGKLIGSWQFPARAAHWPGGLQGLLVDKQGNIWMTGAGRRPGIHVARPAAKNSPWGGGNLLKFSKEGKLLLEIGRNPKPDGQANNQDTSSLGFPTGVDIDEQAHEIYVADGYVNRRLMVYDSDTGAFKRGWGAYGKPLSEIENFTYPDDPTVGRPPNLGQDYNPSAPPSKDFRGPIEGPHVSRDGFVYIADGENDRIQVFTRQGTFVKEFFVAPRTLDEGTIMDFNFSRDPEQKYLLVADGSNQVVWILDRKDGHVVTRFGHRGHNAGQFSYLYAVDMDSHGDIYTGEVKYNYRIQKFLLQP